MKNISKQEIISNLHDKISQFKSNFSKNKETRKDIPELKENIIANGNDDAPLSDNSWAMIASVNGI